MKAQNYLVGVATGTSQRNPGTFLKGLCGGCYVLTRADHCPAKGQPLQESSGVFLWADRQLVRVTGEGWGYAQSWGSPERRNGWRRQRPRTNGYRVSAAPKGRLIEGAPALAVGMARCAHQRAYIKQKGVEMNVVQMPSQEQETEIDFADFWGMYPRRVAKKDARRAWEKIPEKTHAAILVALFEWKRIWQDRGEIEYIPYPASWLNGERWEDEYPPHHRPYTAMQHVAAQQVKPDESRKQPMPAHVLDALKKIRATL